jgi:meso-butanediol dehydrogenase / (S,S)-butanediol dehydrogenase / diacetyl reductase
LKGVYLCCKYAVAEMMKGEGGSIINISSAISGLVKDSHFTYAASKGGVIALTKAIAMQHADYNIRANVICPGPIDTGKVYPQSKTQPQYDFKYDFGARLIKRKGLPKDIGYAAVYLASEEAGFVTGSVFTIDGGSLRN